ncbi:uncharacterized protein L3040_008415 [Drepanopeziza brunnea f. sp. 'multigermtubi']|uniref:uncharacterized protein n=1 Tax=Drepanopeziza brunnea f. sp. 'multigermtubi' TaxID=698441 RepID=UPI00238C92E2|nr:hypothetical protein L3040_008415 [Drepanopeziza brunnea f. sp. 'multigermtubi']
MPEEIKGVRSNSEHNADTSAPLQQSPTHDRRITFEHGRSPTERDESAAYYDSRAATQFEFQRRASTLQKYYCEHPQLLPQLPFTFHHGFKRWKLGGYIALMVFDACVVPILLYYAMTFGGNVEGFITFSVVTAIWGGPTYVEFAIRSLRLIKQQRFYKPLGVDKRWAFDITNWIMVLTIAVVTTLLIIGAVPHDVFLRVLSMPGPAILFCIAGPVFLMSIYDHFGWRAPFRISSTPKGELVHPGIFYIVEDIVAVNSGGGRPFREGMDARYRASPIFRKLIRDLSWFWSIPGLIMASASTVVVVINQVPEEVSYGIGWGVPFLWAIIWAVITVPWVRKVMARERSSWETETKMMTSTMSKPPSLHDMEDSEQKPRTSIPAKESTETTLV